TLELIVGQKVLLKKVQQGKLLASVEPDCSLVIKIKPLEPLIYAATLLVKEEVVARFKLEIELA
ncbi:MAG: hypothetical protein IJS50_04660, partial [Desulfovibrio sp.]|nr:hypothetical protein [Desulfovibrio sp.]